MGNSLATDLVICKILDGTGDFLLSKITQAQKDKFYMILLMCKVQKN